MSKKNKGRKVDLTTFLAGADPTLTLPKAPSGQPREERRNARKFGGEGMGDGEDEWRRGGPERSERSERGGFERGGFERGGFERGGDRGGFRDEPISAADSDDQWRRGPPPPRAERGERGERGGGFGDGLPSSAADEDDHWRRGPPPAAAPTRPLADDDGDWRGSRIKPQAEAPKADPLSDDNWRRGTAVTQASSNTTANPLADDNWRKNTPPPAPVPSEDDGRPKLKLKPRSDKDTGEVPASEDVPIESGNKEEGSKADKWDKIFSSKSSEGDRPHRMFGDRPKDVEREKLFYSANRGPSQRPGAHAFGTGRKRGGGGGEEDAPQRTFPGRSADQPRREFPGSGRGPTGPPPRQFPGSSSRSRDSERDLDRQRAAMAFGGGRRDRGDRTGYQPEEPRASVREEYVGGMERFQANRPESSPEKPSTPGKSLADLTKIADQVGGWGSDEEDKPTTTAPAATKKAQQQQAPKLSEEELVARTDAALKQYMLLENKRDTISEVKKMNSPEYMPNFVRKAISKTFEEGSLKACKLVVSLLVALVKEKLLSNKAIAEGLDLACTKQKSRLDAQGAEGKTNQIRSCASLMQENDLLKDVELTETVKEIAFPQAEEQSADPETGAKSVDEELLASVLASGKLGEDLAEMVDMAKVSPAFGAEFLQRLFREKPTLVEDDVECEWLDESKYGALLTKTLFAEDPSEDVLKVEVDALLAIQTAFAKVRFPRAPNGQAIIEKVFMKLYNDDIIPPEAMIAWKEDLSDSPGKMDAIVQLSQFVNWLEEDDEEDDE